MNSELLDLLVKERRQYRRAFFRYHGVGPWPCVGCSDLVYIDELDVHHADRDHTNEEPDNLVSAHRSCHAAVHWQERGPEAAKVAMAAASAIRWSQPGADKRYSATMKAKPKTNCDLCGKEVYEMHLGRHRRSRTCQQMRKGFANEDNFGNLQYTGFKT